MLPKLHCRCPNKSTGSSKSLTSCQLTSSIWNSKYVSYLQEHSPGCLGKAELSGISAVAIERHRFMFLSRAPQGHKLVGSKTMTGCGTWVQVGTWESEETCDQGPCSSSDHCLRPLGPEQTPTSEQAQPAASDGGALGNGIWIPINEGGRWDWVAIQHKHIATREVNALVSQSAGSRWDALPSSPVGS